MIITSRGASILARAEPEELADLKSVPVGAPSTQDKHAHESAGELPRGRYTCPGEEAHTRRLRSRASRVLERAAEKSATLFLHNCLRDYGRRGVNSRGRDIYRPCSSQAAEFGDMKFSRAKFTYSRALSAGKIRIRGGGAGRAKNRGKGEMESAGDVSRKSSRT